MRRTPLTDLLGTFKLDSTKLSTPKLTGLGRRGKTLAYGGTALALAGIGGVTAAAATSTAPAAAGIAGASHRLDAGTSHRLSVGDAAGVQLGSAVSARPATSASAPAFAAAPSRATVASDKQPAAVKTAGSGKAHAAVKTHAAVHVVRHESARSWKQIRDDLASQTSPRPEPGKLPLADRLVTGPASGPQSYLPIDSGRMANATAIVRQALRRHMGLRAAVIAVATAMQESGLENISYGDRDSLGLFQQRPSMGWGSAAQITTPSYAADAFLTALAAHQKTDPSWAGQPLWATAQAVQKSGFPFAYAKWEKQAAQLVTTIATKLG